MDEEKRYLEFLGTPIDELVQDNEEVTKNKESLEENIKRLDLIKKGGFLIGKNKEGEVLLSISQSTVNSAVGNAVEVLALLLQEDAKKQGSSMSDKEAMATIGAIVVNIVSSNLDD